MVEFKPSLTYVTVPMVRDRTYPRRVSSLIGVLSLWSLVHEPRLVLTKHAQKSQRAYLRADCKNSSSMPLLAGPASVFTDVRARVERLCSGERVHCVCVCV